MADDAIDPRLVALGLVPPPAAVPSTPAAAPTSPPPAAARTPAPAAPPRPAPAPAAATAAWQIIPPPAPPPDVTTAIVPEAVRVFAQATREGELELWTDHVAVGKRHLEWSAARGVTTRGACVRIKIDERKVFAFTPTVDGVGDSTLAKIVAEIVLDSSGGAAPRAKLLRQLTDTSAEIKRRFRDQDDQLVPLLVLVATLVVLVPLVFAIPLIVEAPFRGGASAPADTFLMYPRLSGLDPRSLVAAFAGAAAVAGLAMRLAAGRDLLLWAHATLAGWRHARRANLDPLRRAAALLIAGPRPMAIVFLVAFLLFLPAGRERVRVADDGVHIRASLPFFDRDVPWSDVTSATVRPSGSSFAVTLSTRDGVIADTRGADFFGLSEYELGQFAQRHGAALK